MAGHILLYAPGLLISTSSYYFMDTHSGDTLSASILPWVSGISLCVNIIVLIFKYHSSGGSDAGGFDCGGDGGYD